MLDRLPTELLLLIIQLAAPLTYCLAPLRERAKTLGRLVRVSRQLRDWAQPMLWEVIGVEGEEGVDKLMRTFEGGEIPYLPLLPEGAGGGRLSPLLNPGLVAAPMQQRRLKGVDELARGPNRFTRTLSVSGMSETTLTRELRLHEPFAQVERIQLTGEWQFKVDFTIFGNFPCLRHLTLSGLALTLDKDTAVVLPHLVELSLHKVELSEDAFASILTSKTLPALHVLALGPPAHRLARHFVIPPDLLNQLAALQLSGTTFAPSLLKHRVPKLFILLRDSAVDFPPGIPSSFRHISISFPATILPGPPASVEYLTYDMTWYQQALDAVAALPDLETLWLPLVFHPSTPVNPSVHIPTAVNSFKDKVIEVCDTKGVKVRWRSRPFSATSSLTFCLDFLDYAEELNAAQATTGNAAA